MTAMEPTRKLLEQVSAGSAPAVDELLVRHLPGLHAYVRLRAGPAVRAREGVSDLVQSVCRDVLEHAGNFRWGGEAGFRHWLYTAALRRIQGKHDFHRAQRRDVAREAAPRPGGSSSSGVPDLMAYQRALGTPSEAAIGREQLERIERAFDTLTEEQREIIVQSRLIGLSHSEIAAHLGKSEGATRVLLHRALARLAGALDEQAGAGT